MGKPVKGIIDGREIVDDRGYDCPTQLEDGTAVYIIPTADLEALVGFLLDYAKAMDDERFVDSVETARAFLAERNLEVGE